MNHEIVEKNAWLMGTLIAIVISVGGLVEIVPLCFQASVISPSPGLKPYPPLRLAGRDVYVREGCYLCHSQMIRPLAGGGGALRPLLDGRRVGLRPSVPVGLQAHRPGPRARRRHAIPMNGIAST